MAERKADEIGEPPIGETSSFDGGSKRGGSTPARRKPRRQQAERSASTIRKLLDAAVDSLTKVGYQHLTVELIAANAKVSRGAVQHHFGSRENLLAAVVSDLGQALTAGDPIDNDLPLLRRLDKAIDRDWAVFSSPQFLAVIQIWMAERGNAKLFPQIQLMVREVENYLDSQWASALEDSGLSEREIVALRHVVLSSLRGLALRTVSIGSNATWQEELEMLKRMVRQLLTESGPHPGAARAASANLPGRA
ncbi:TetR/AcrR family transcriptional regulator [Oricola thermophila]|uniref:TetR/AcrR family transcriptional regulator n=1 Tax=Oricola thermophila TaxID=2742145 RepID=A0A6N1VH89_9HYPH|nr:TetR/AcrR family transcriptional regulator [Oricola thermophila]QKV20174.1 TetR/AcrR family transcriptional regulator [Oricola thermophila]